MATGEKANKPKLEFIEFKVNDHEALYGAFEIGEREYSLREFISILTSEQIERLRRRLDDTLEMRASD